MRGVRGMLVAVVLALPGSASASTICVNASAGDCTPPVESSLQTGLNRAQSNPGTDTVRVGPGDYATTTTSGFSYTSPDPITLSGAGAGRTVIRNGVASPNSVLTVNVTAPGALVASTVSGISVSGADLPNSGSAAFIGANVTDSDFAGAGSANSSAYALRLFPGAAVSRVTATARGPFAVGVGLIGSGSVSDSAISATIGVELIPSGTAPTGVVRRTRILASRTGVDVCNSAAVMEDTSIQSNGTGVDVEGSQRCGASNSQLTARNLTITGAGSGPGGTGVDVTAGNSSPSATLVDSILWNLTTSLTAAAAPGYTSTLSVARLAEDPSKRTVGGGGGTVSFSDGGGDVGDPLLVDSAHGDLRLGSGSPAIDAGTPGPVAAGESTTDRDGAPRVLDGNGDGTERRDMGALEAPTVAVPPAPATSQPAGGGPATTTAARDRTAPKLTGLKLRRGAHPRLLLRLSEAAKVTVTVRGLPKGCRRVSKRCRERALATQRAALKAGSRTVTLSRAVRLRLARATRLRVSAVDAAGNRSPVSSLKV